jgi:hypothetical protein
MLRVGVACSAQLHQFHQIQSPLAGFDPGDVIVLPPIRPAPPMAMFTLDVPACSLRIGSGWIIRRAGLAKIPKDRKPGLKLRVKLKK